MLKAENVWKVYHRERVLHDINLEVKSGEILGLVGESGCGKSTLARLLCCYEHPSSGKVKFNGRDTTHRTKRERSEFHRNCQLILQDNLSSLDPTMTVGDTLLETLKYNSRLNEVQSREKILSILEKLLLDPQALEKMPIQLSGGERQRINICRALLVEPKLLICDEITSSLDVITQYNLLKMLKQINSETGLPLVFISHDINAVKSISDRILVMHDGTIAEELNKSDGFLYSGRYTKRLFESLPITHPSQRLSLARHFDDKLFSDD